MATKILNELAEELPLLQKRIVNKNRQVLIIFEGCSGRVMGRVINEFMNLMESRGIQYTQFILEGIVFTRDMLKYLAREPAKCKILIYNLS